ncbi:MAG: Spy/CpxP family protein refolding chaperone [Sulfurospirillaceae bacterium]|nr:Spy/CpxP family protein refolding chaperone [Sulfurospirillaceae bacterium]MDD3462404.1 Spy/CpxP family protein refolding chaperone [Sulfurospirillaceae bacterium]
MKKTILTVATLLALSSSAFAMNGAGPMAQNTGVQNPQNMSVMKGKRGGGMRGDSMMMMLSKIDLSEDQRHKLGIAQAEMKLEMKKAQDPKMQQKMRDLMSKDTFDKKEFLKLTNDMHEKMTTIRANHMEKVFTLLTKEQRAQLATTQTAKPAKK